MHRLDRTEIERKQKPHTHREQRHYYVWRSIT